MSEGLLGGLHCLIVDDDRPFLTVVEHMLRALGVAKISSATSGSEAINLLTTTPRPVDVTLCDLDMPSGNGLQLLQAVRTGQVPRVRPDSCFIVLTGFATPDLITTAGRLDASGYLVKPIVPEKLAAAIAKGRSRVIAIDHAKYAQVMVPAALV